MRLFCDLSTIHCPEPQSCRVLIQASWTRVQTLIDMLFCSPKSTACMSVALVQMRLFLSPPLPSLSAHLSQLAMPVARSLPGFDRCHDLEIVQPSSSLPYGCACNFRPCLRCTLVPSFPSVGKLRPAVLIKPGLQPASVQWLLQASARDVTLHELTPNPKQ